MLKTSKRQSKVTTGKSDSKSTTMTDLTNVTMVSTRSRNQKECPTSSKRKPKKAALANEKKVKITTNSSVSEDKRQPKPSSSKKSPQNTKIDKKPQIEDEIEPYVKLYKKISKVLGSSYIDVANRLKLENIPHCVTNNDFCAVNHAKKCERPDPIEYGRISTTTYFASQNRCFISIKFIEDLCLRDQFPGENLMLHLIQLILTVTDPVQSKPIIEESILVFRNIVGKFPPCWYDIQDSYRKLFLNNVDMSEFLPEMKNSKMNIIEFVLNMLNEIMYEEEAVSDKKNLDEDCDESMSYEAYERRNTHPQRFDNHNRTDKLDRLFIVLELCVHILEYDLPIWIRRHLRNTYDKMFDDKKPLTAHIFFDGSCNNTTPLVKTTISIFVNCICFSYPNHQINILSRLISLLSNAIYLCERDNKDNGILYPHISFQCETFAKEIFKIIESNVGRNLRYIFAITRNIRSSFTKYLLIFHILDLMNNDRGQINIEKIFNDFNQQRWLLECRPDIASPIKNSEKLEKPTKYPVIPKQILRKPKSDEIYREEYLSILLDALKAYCDVYDMKRISNVFLNKEEEPKMVPISPKKFDDRSFDLCLMEKDIEALEKSLNLKETRVKYQPAETVSFHGIYVDHEIVLRYRNDMKFLMILKKLINELWNEHGEIFNEWHNFMENILPL